MSAVKERKKREWTPEQKEAARQRMANARAAKGNAPAPPPVPMRRIQAEINPMVDSIAGSKYKDDEDNHYFLCIEPPKDLNMPSERGKFERAGYKVIEEVQEGMCWMHLGMAKYREFQKQQEELTASKWARPLVEEPENKDEARVVSIQHSRTPQFVGTEPA